MTVLGLMSGTSFDGLDLCVVRFNQTQEGYHYEIKHSSHRAYPETFVSQLKRAHLATETEMLALEESFDAITISAIKELFKHYNKSIDLISSHGHTTLHQPERGITRQIGNGKLLSKTFNIPVAYDFRSSDLALGGQGAPLVPIGDHLLFHNYDICLNLGGISNLSYSFENKRHAFDVGMFNTPINELVEPLGYNYDKDGNIAANGSLITSLFERLNSLEFYTIQGAKSLGKEWYYSYYVKEVEAVKGSLEDLVRTVTEHNVYQIFKALKEFYNRHKIAKKLKVLVTGGGAHNRFAMQLLQSQTKNFASMIVPDSQLVDYKEALVFAFMGYLRVHNKINVYSSVTGASSDSCAGTLIQPNEQRTFS